MVDLAILSQALHHAIRPERAVASAHRILRKGGRLVILDLLSHRFERARELYADHWLGFSEVQLHQFLESAGFKNIEVTVHARKKKTPHFEPAFATGVKKPAADLGCPCPGSTPFFWLESLTSR